jgi:diguanylate cyclase (GGDEF)-like protein
MIMVSSRLSSLAVLINRLTSIPPGGEGKTTRARFETLDAAVEADTYVLLKRPTGASVFRVLGEKGLTVPIELWKEGIESPRINSLIADCLKKQVISVKGPFTDDPFLSGAGTAWLLMACLNAGQECMITVAMRRRDKAFVKSERDRFGAVAQVLNLQAYCRMLEEESARLRISDPVTGLGFYPVFHQTLGRELSRSRRRAGKVSVGILALGADRFTVSGEEIPANEIVRFVAQALRSQLRNFDTIVRYSPHEFAFILPDIAGSDVMKAMDRVLGAIKSEAGKACPEIHIGLSCYPEDASTVERLIETAEAAVNIAREKGPMTVLRWKEE